MSNSGSDYQWPYMYKSYTGNPSSTCDETRLPHYSDVTGAARRLKSLAPLFFVQQLDRDNNIENIKASSCKLYMREMH